MTTPQNQKSNTILIREKTKKIGKKVGLTQKISTINLKILDLLPNINIKRIKLIESDLYISEILQKKKDEKTKELKKVLTKSEKIISKLIKLKEKAIKVNDTISIQDIDWIISKINDQNLYDIDTNDFNSTIRNDSNNNGLVYLMQYSQYQNQYLVQKAFQETRKNNIIDNVKMSFQRKSSLAISNSIKVLNKYDMNKNLNTINENTNLSNNLLQNQMALIDSTQFDIFSIYDIVKDKTTILISNEILLNLNIVKENLVDIKILENFIKKIISGYDRKNVLYHNDFHAVDIMQTLYTILTKGKIIEKMKLNQIDIFTILISAICHDLHHTGQNNIFHINSKSKYAIRYNDISVLENFHISSTFKILKNEEFNILKKFKEEEYKIIRKRMIQSILSTDMSNHQKVLSNVKGKINEFSILKGVNFEKIFLDENKLFDNQQIMLDLFLHSSDISNPAKPKRISLIWTQKVYSEFFKQGDLEKEKGLNVSLLCDRDNTNINKAMVGFINFVSKPTFEIIVNIIPECSNYLFNIKENLYYYENRIKEEKNEKFENFDNILDYNSSFDNDKEN